MCFCKKMLYHNSQGKFDRFGFDEVFGRSAVMELLGYLNRKSESKYPAFSH